MCNARRRGAQPFSHLVPGKEHPTQSYLDQPATSGIHERSAARTILDSVREARSQELEVPNETQTTRSSAPPAACSAPGDSARPRDTGDSQTGGAPLATGALMTTLSAKVGNRRATCKGPRPLSARLFAMHDGLAKLLASEGTGIGSGRIMPIRHRSLAIILQRLFPVA